MHFTLALLIAVNFWHARGVEVPCHPVAVPGADAQMPLDAGVTHQPTAVLMAATSGCRVLLSSFVVNLRNDHDEAPLYCADVAHEIGHLAGLSHTATGIMRASGPDWDEYPWDCVHWRHFQRTLHHG